MKQIMVLTAATLTIFLATAMPDRSIPARDSPAADGGARRIRADVVYLADDLLEGRQAGTRGYDLAASYVAARFAGLGLEAGAADGGWYQAVKLVDGSAVIPAAELVLIRDGREQALESSVDFLPSPDTNSADTQLTAPLVFVGFGIHAPALGQDDFVGAELRGKIAVLISGAPQRFPSTERAHYSSTLTKYPELVKRGAVGVLSLQTPADYRRIPWSRIVQAAWRPRMRWLDASNVAADSFPQLKALFGLSPSGAERVMAGAPKSLESLIDDAQQGRGRAFDLGVSARTRRQTLLGERRSANVLGLLPGSDPRLANEVIVVTTHLDGLGKGAPVAGDGIYNGAVDNATGVAVLIETARMLIGGRQRLRRPVLFAAVTAEESGLLGSDYLARHPPRPGMRFVANINIDMPVMLGEIADLVAFGAEHTSLGGVAAKAARGEGLALTPDPMPEETIFVRSDQYSFVRQGVPAVFLSHGVASLPGANAADNRALVDQFLKTHYHQPTDQVDLPIHYPSLLRLARINARMIGDIANGSAPRWNADSFLGRAFASPVSQ
jgi:Peptidase family M28